MQCESALGRYYVFRSDTTATQIYALSLHDALPILEFPGNTFGLALNLEQDSVGAVVLGEYKHLGEGDTVKTTGRILEVPVRSEEHTSELQSRRDLVCRLPLEKKKSRAAARSGAIRT